MKSNIAIRKAIKESGMTQARVGALLGTTQSNLARKLCSDNLTAEQMVSILDAAGYELVVQPKMKGRRPKHQILIDQKGE